MQLMLNVFYLWRFKCLITNISQVHIYFIDALIEMKNNFNDEGFHLGSLASNMRNSKEISTIEIKQEGNLYIPFILLSRALPCSLVNPVSFSSVHLLFRWYKQIPLYTYYFNLAFRPKP